MGELGSLSLELLRLGLGSPQPLLVFGELLVLDREHERGGDRGADLHVALVVPVLTRRDEEEPPAHLLTEQQWHIGHPGAGDPAQAADA